MTLNAHLLLPVGTQVVALVEVRGADGKAVHPRGAVGVVVQAPADPWHSYRVRFPDDVEAAFRRQDLAILAHYQECAILAAGESGADATTVVVAAAAVDQLGEHHLFDHVIYRCIVGSRAHALDDAGSDTDRRGIYLPPADRHWSLYGVPEQSENPATEEVYWEARKFVTLALKANPNVLECLYTPLIEHATPVARELLDLRPRLLSRMVYQTYNGYVMSQFKKLQADLRNEGQVKWKHVMHLLRLLLAGITVLEESYVPVHVDGLFRDRLLAIRRGETPLQECEAWRRELHERFDRAVERTTLPERPDYAAANDWLLRARRSVI